MIDNMVKLSFEEAGKLRLMFNMPELNEESRLIKSREVKVVREGKVIHARQFLDSANPERNKTEILKRGKDKI